MWEECVQRPAVAVHARQTGGRAAHYTRLQQLANEVLRVGANQAQRVVVERRALVLHNQGVELLEHLYNRNSRTKFSQAIRPCTLLGALLPSPAFGRSSTSTTTLWWKVRA